MFPFHATSSVFTYTLLSVVRSEIKFRVYSGNYMIFLLSSPHDFPSLLALPSPRRSWNHFGSRFITHYIVASWVKPRRTGFALRAAASISTTSNQNWRTRPAWPTQRSLLSSKITRIASTWSQHSRLWSRTDNLRVGGVVPRWETKEARKIIDPLGSFQSRRYEGLTMPQCTCLSAVLALLTVRLKSVNSSVSFCLSTYLFPFPCVYVLAPLYPPLPSQPCL